MKDFLFKLAFFIFILIILPFVLVRLYSSKVPVDKKEHISLYLSETHKCIKLSLEEYVAGVLCAEMPASFHEEALKSQAIAARTYALYKMKNGSHDNGDVCNDFTHCQAYCSHEDMIEKWGNEYETYIKKINKCVNETKGMYISLNDEPINAVFHACSNGKTENASDVWGSDIIYLKSVDSRGDLLKKEYEKEYCFNESDLIKLLENEIKSELDKEQNPIGKIEYTEGDNIKTVEIFGFVFKGKDIRKILSLDSSAFNISYENNIFTFRVYGNGHGVGMSQYGADAMAKDGKTYDEIIKHYYTGCDISIVK